MIKHTIAGLTTAIALAASLGAQTQNTGFEITKITPELVQSPAISFTGGPTGKSKGKSKGFLAVETAFDWQPKEKKPAFLDELTVNYYILLANKGADPENPQAETLLTGSVTHVSIPQEKDLKSVIYVSPRTLEKFFAGKMPATFANLLKDVGVTITRGGEVVAQGSWKSDIRHKTPWWESSTPPMTPTPGLLLNKNQTPFAPLVWDYYEEVKPTGTK